MVLVSAIEASRILRMSPQGVYVMRKTGRLRPERTRPFRFDLAVVEGVRAGREGKPHRGRRGHGIEITTTKGN